MGESFRTGTLKTPGPTLTTVVATVKVYGTTLGGQDVESGGFSFPIQLCNGCSIDYQAVDPANSNLCTAKAGTVVPPSSCRLGQDGTTDCRSCLSLPICLCPYSMDASGGACQ